MRKFTFELTEEESQFLFDALNDQILKNHDMKMALINSQPHKEWLDKNTQFIRNIIKKIGY